jgi:cytochrome c-type biogenesis protein
MELLFGFLAGVFTTLSPCVLPLIPIIMGSALQADRSAPLFLTAGFALSFAVVGLIIASIGMSLGLDPLYLRYGAAVVMGVFGLIMLLPVLYERFALAASGLTGSAGNFVQGLPVDSKLGHFGLGALLGIVWTPCAGPTLGAAVGLASQTSQLPKAMAIMLVFGLGASLPMLALSYGSRTAVMGRKSFLAVISKYGKPAMGIVLIAISMLTLTGVDKRVEAQLTSLMPDWLFDLTTRY